MPPDWVFPPFRIDRRSEQLWNETQTIELRPKTFSTLCYLLEHAGQLVKKEELLEAVWPDTTVGDAVLKVSIRELRDALGDTSAKPQFIETVHRRGYRFIAPLTTAPHSVSGSTFQVPRFQESNNAQARETWNAKPETAFVGRDTELAQLHDLFEKALRSERQLAFVTGDAGIGKTALVEAFLFGVQEGSEFGVSTSPRSKVHTLKLRTPHSELPLTLAPLVVRGQCFDHYGPSEAYLPILEAISLLCRRPEREHIIMLLQHYAPTWLAQLPAVLSATERDALARRRLGSSQERMLREMADFLEALAQDAPVILVLEDLHWSDTATLDFISVFARRAAPARILLLSTYRPVELILNNHPLKYVKQELESHRKCVDVTLELLPAEAVEQFVETRLPTDRHASTAVHELAAFIHRRTDGHPLFMTALVDEAVNRQSALRVSDQEPLQATIAALDQGVPENVRHLIERQKEQLHEDAQHVLEVASVVGSEFSAATVAAALDKEQEWVEDYCHQLTRRRQFLQPVGLAEWPDGTVAGRYAFLHALHQNVFYEGIAPARQVQLHRRVGEREEAAYGDRAGEIAAVLAHHFDRGHEYRRAVRYLQLSATAAKGRAAPREGIQTLTKALQLLQMWPEGAERLGQELSLQLALGSALMATHGYASVEVERAFVRAREICQQLGTTPLLFPALWGVWAFHVVRGDLHPARELAKECFALAQATQDPDMLIEAHHALWVTLFFSSQFAESLMHIEQGLALYTPAHQSFIPVSGQDAGVAGFSYRALALCFRGYHEQALHASQQALAHAQGLGHSFSVGFAMQFAAWTHFCRGDSKTGRAQTEAMIAFSTAQGFPFWLAGALHFHAWAVADQGQLEDGLALVQQGMEAWQATGAKLGLPSHLATFADLCARAGRVEEAFSQLAQAFAATTQTGQYYYDAELWRLKGQFILQSGVRCPVSSSPSPQPLTPSPQGEVEREAEECFLKAIEIAGQQQSKWLELRASTSLARLWGQQGKQPEAHTLLSTIYNWFTEGFDCKDLQEAQTLLAELKGEAEKKVPQQKPRERNSNAMVKKG